MPERGYDPQFLSDQMEPGLLERHSLHLMLDLKRK
jgi:hypothetical protein